MTRARWSSRRHSPGVRLWSPSASEMACKLVISDAGGTRMLYERHDVSRPRRIRETADHKLIQYCGWHNEDSVSAIS